MDQEKDNTTSDKTVLVSFSPHTFTNLSENDYAAQLIQKIPRAWEFLCKHHYQLTPLTGQDAREVFLGEYYYQQFFQSFNQKKLSAANEWLHKALAFGNYKALEHICLHSIEMNDFSQALAWAKCCANIYLTPGYMLLAYVYHAISASPNLSPKEKKDNILSAIININLATELMPHSKIALQNTGWNVTNVSLNQLTEEYMNEVPFTAADKTMVIEEAARQLAEINIPA